MSLAVFVVATLAACSTTPPSRHSAEPAVQRPTAPTIAATTPKKSGGYYLDDGPGDSPPPNLDLLPDAMPRVEKFASGANRPYNVFGVDYVPDLSGASYRQRGVGSWYGRKFHGQRTSSGEIYDMYAMTAAHPTLPIPCYALVTNVQNGKSVIVRVNDRGPFLHNRVMDLSYAAASKVGYLSSGSGLIEVEMLSSVDIAAGRIPVTTNSLAVAAAAADGRRLPSMVAATTTPAAAAPPAIVATLGSTTATTPASSDGPRSTDTDFTVVAAPVEAPMPASYAARGIPPDLLPDPLPAKLPESRSTSGFYLQLGAFRARTGADSFAAHVTREVDPTLASKMQVSETNGLFRVRIGPYPERADADSAALSLRSAISRPVMVMPEGMAR